MRKEKFHNEKYKDTSKGNTYKHTVKINLTTYGIEKLA